MSKIVEIALRHKGLKALSLLLAVAVWMLVSQEGSRTRTEKIPVRFVYPQENYFLLGSPPDDIDVVLSGPARAMNQLSVNTLSAEIDILQKLRDQGVTLPAKFVAPEEIVLRPKPSDIRGLPPAVTAEVRQRKIRLLLDQIGEKLLQVKPRLTGTIRDGYAYRIYVDPKQVTVYGPRSILAKLDSIYTRPLSLDGRDSTWEDTRWPLDTTPRVGGKPLEPADCLRPKPPSVICRLEVHPVGVKDTLKNVPILVYGLPGFRYTILMLDRSKAYTVIPTLDIRGPKDLLRNPNLRAFIDLTTDRPEEKTEVEKTVQFSAEEGIEILTPPITVWVQIEPGKSG